MILQLLVQFNHIGRSMGHPRHIHPLRYRIKRIQFFHFRFCRRVPVLNVGAPTPQRNWRLQQEVQDPALNQV